MEHQSDTHPPDITSTNPPIVNPPAGLPQTRPNPMRRLLATLLVSGILFGLGGYYIRKQSTETTNGQRQIEISPSPSVVATPTSKFTNKQTDRSAPENWHVYTDQQLNFSLKYPDTYTLIYLQEQPYLNRIITWHSSNMLVKDQRGDGPIVKSEEIVSVPVAKTERFILEFGSIGGEIPHEEVWYQFANPHSTTSKDTYITIRLSAIPVSMTPEEIKLYSETIDTQKLNAETINIFNQIVTTLKLQ